MVTCRRKKTLQASAEAVVLAASPGHLQALIDALAAYCASLQLQISVPKTKAMIVSAVLAPVVTFTCNPIEQVATFKYLGLHFLQSGSIAHLVMPIKSKAGASWAAVQRRHSLQRCGNTTNLHLQLLQAILVPVLQYGVCKALVLLLLVMLVLRCRVCMITT